MLEKDLELAQTIRNLRKECGLTGKEVALNVQDSRNY